ncbi:MAG: phosphate signaling complex PhoU family protein, partial [bacterium]
EAKLDDYEIQMSESIINIIVLYNPVASDLRKIIACYRMVLNLERIGDLIMGTVSYIDRIKDPAIFKKSSTLIDNMLILSTQMVTRALLSYTNRDKEDAIWTIKNDSVVDELNHKLLKKSILKEKLPDETRKMLMSFINIKSIITNIERIADHATNIAEASIYAMEGKDMRHRNMENE